MVNRWTAIGIIVVIAFVLVVSQLVIASNNDRINKYRDYCDYGYTVIFGSIVCKNHSEFREMIDNSMYRDYNMKGYNDKVIRIDEIGWSFYSEVWSLNFDTSDSCNAKEIWKQTNQNNTNIGFCKPTLVSGYSLAPFHPVTNISYFEGKVIQNTWQEWNKDQEIVLESGDSFHFDETTNVKIGSVITVKKTEVLQECLISDVGIESALGNSNLIGNGTNDTYLWNFIRNGNDTVYQMGIGYAYQWSVGDDWNRKETNCMLQHGSVITFEVIK